MKVLEFDFDKLAKTLFLGHCNNRLITLNSVDLNWLYFFYIYYSYYCLYLKCLQAGVIFVLCDLQITFANDVGKFDLEVTTFQMAVLFAWNQRPKDHISYESLQLATELPDTELRKTLFVRHCVMSV